MSIKKESTQFPECSLKVGGCATGVALVPFARPCRATVAEKKKSTQFTECSLKVGGYLLSHLV